MVPALPDMANICQPVPSAMLARNPLQAGPHPRHCRCSAALLADLAQVMDLLVAQQSCTPDQAPRLGTRPGVQQHTSSSKPRPGGPDPNLTPLNSALQPPQQIPYFLGRSAPPTIRPDPFRSHNSGPSGFMAQQRFSRPWPGSQRQHRPQPTPGHSSYPPGPFARPEAQDPQEHPGNSHPAPQFPRPSFQPGQDPVGPAAQTQQAGGRQEPVQGFRPPQEQGFRLAKAPTPLQVARPEATKPTQSTPNSTALPALQQLLARCVLAMSMGSVRQLACVLPQHGPCHHQPASQTVRQRYTLPRAGCCYVSAWVVRSGLP